MYREKIQNFLFDAKLNALKTTMETSFQEKQNRFQEKIVQLEQQNTKLQEKLKALEKDVDNRSNFPAFEAGKSINGLENEFGLLKKMVHNQQNSTGQTG